MRHGFLSLLIFILICAGIAYAVYILIFGPPKNYSKQLQDAYVTLPKYPNAKTWTFEPRRKICILRNEPCGDSAVIDFATADQWRDVFLFYRDNLKSFGWQNNSTIVLSLPQTILFENRLGCKALLQPYSPQLQIQKKQQNPNFRFLLTCIPAKSDLIDF